MKSFCLILQHTIPIWHRYLQENPRVRWGAHLLLPGVAGQHQALPLSSPHTFYIVILAVCDTTSRHTEGPSISGLASLNILFFIFLALVQILMVSLYISIYPWSWESREKIHFPIHITTNGDWEEDKKIEFKFSFSSFLYGGIQSSDQE